MRTLVVWQPVLQESRCFLNHKGERGNKGIEIGSLGERDRENEFIEIEGLKRGKEMKIRRLGMETRT